MREAITSAAPTEILSAWRTRAVPLGQVEKRVHQQVLRTFATTAHPPAASDLEPSADCCCDYLNFFADRAAADAWSSSHPQIPGQVLDQRQAEDLSARLFQPLLAR